MAALPMVTPQSTLARIEARSRPGIRISHRGRFDAVNMRNSAAAAGGGYRISDRKYIWSFPSAPLPPNPASTEIVGLPKMLRLMCFHPPPPPPKQPSTIGVLFFMLELSFGIFGSFLKWCYSRMPPPKPFVIDAIFNIFKKVKQLIFPPPPPPKPIAIRVITRLKSWFFSQTQPEMSSAMVVISFILKLSTAKLASFMKFWMFPPPPPPKPQSARDALLFIPRKIKHLLFPEPKHSFAKKLALFHLYILLAVFVLILELMFPLPPPPPLRKPTLKERVFLLFDNIRMFIFPPPPPPKPFHEKVAIAFIKLREKMKLYFFPPPPKKPSVLLKFLWLLAEGVKRVFISDINKYLVELLIEQVKAANVCDILKRWFSKIFPDVSDDMILYMLAFYIVFQLLLMYCGVYLKA